MSPKLAVDAGYSVHVVGGGGVGGGGVLVLALFTIMHNSMHMH